MATASPANDQDREKKVPITRKPTPKPVKTKFQPTEEERTRLRRNAERARRASGAFVDVSRTIMRQIDEKETVREAPEPEFDPGYARVSPAILRQISGDTPDQPAEEVDEGREQGMQGEQNQPGSSVANEMGRRFGQRAMSRGKQELAKRFTQQATKKATGQAVKRIAAQVALKNPYVLAAIGIVVAVIAVIVIVFIFVFAVANMNGDPAGSGTSATVAYASSGSDLSKLRTTLAGRIDSADKARTIIDHITQLESKYASNDAALRLLGEAKQAAQNIIDADPGDTATIGMQEVIIKKRIRDFLDIISIQEGDCAGATVCLDVQPIAQAARGHCGVASALMAIYYSNGNQKTEHFDPDKHISNNGGVLTDSSRYNVCMGDVTINSMVPPDKRGWTRYSWRRLPGSTEEQKRGILDGIIRSLEGGDPVIMYFKAGGTAGGIHIVLVVGHDANDEPDEFGFGTFIINNPNVGRTIPKTKYGLQGRSAKLTGRWLMQYMSGAADPYPNSIIIRNQYMQ